MIVACIFICCRTLGSTKSTYPCMHDSVKHPYEWQNGCNKLNYAQKKWCCLVVHRAMASLSLAGPGTRRASDADAKMLTPKNMQADHMFQVRRPLFPWRFMHAVPLCSTGYQDPWSLPHAPSGSCSLVYYIQFACTCSYDSVLWLRGVIAADRMTVSAVFLPPSPAIGRRSCTDSRRKLAEFMHARGATGDEAALVTPCRLNVHYFPAMCMQHHLLHAAVGL